MSLSSQPLHKGLDLEDLDQLITPLTTLGHLALLAPEQFAAPLKSLIGQLHSQGPAHERQGGYTHTKTLKYRLTLKRKCTHTYACVHAHRQASKQAGTQTHTYRQILKHRTLGFSSQMKRRITVFLVVTFSVYCGCVVVV